MKKNTGLLLLCGAFILLFSGLSYAYNTDYVIVAIMDGARYTETFDSPALIPRLWNDLRPQGSIITNFRNDVQTVTRYGVAYISTGTWADYYAKKPKYTKQPSIWEYLRKTYGYNENLTSWITCWDGSADWWPFSTHASYGSAYWPVTTRYNTAMTSDDAMWNKCKEEMKYEMQKVRKNHRR